MGPEALFSGSLSICECMLVYMDAVAELISCWLAVDYSISFLFCLFYFFCWKSVSNEMKKWWWRALSEVQVATGKDISVKDTKLPKATVHF